MSENSNPIMSVFNFATEKIKYYINPNEKFVKWGLDNLMPNQLLDFYYNIPEHKSAIDFTTSSVVGNGTNDELLDFWTVSKIIDDYNLFGTYALQVVKLRNGGNKVSYVDVSKCRYSTDNKNIFYSELWDKYKVDYETYPITTSLNKEGIYIYKSSKTREVYPLPNYFAGNLSLDTMYNISLYHNDNAKNGFMPNVVINYNGGGKVSEDIKQKTEALLQKKYTGTSAQKFMIFYNQSKENAAEVIRLNGDNDDKKFETLQKFIQNQIIVAHKLPSGQLIGIKPENQGFSKTEYQESLDIFKEIVVNNIRKELEYSFKLLTDKDIKFQDIVSNNVVSDVNKGTEVING